MSLSRLVTYHPHLHIAPNVTMCHRHLHKMDCLSTAAHAHGVAEKGYETLSSQLAVLQRSSLSMTGGASEVQLLLAKGECLTEAKQTLTPLQHSQLRGAVATERSGAGFKRYRTVPSGPWSFQSQHKSSVLEFVRAEEHSLMQVTAVGCTAPTCSSDEVAPHMLTASSYQQKIWSDRGRFGPSEDICSIPP